MVTNGHSSSLSLSSRGTPQGKNALEAGSRSEAIVKGKLSGTSCYERKCIQMCFLTSPLRLSLTHQHTHTHTELRLGIGPFFSFLPFILSVKQQKVILSPLNNSSISPHRYVCNGAFKSTYSAVSLSCMARLCSHDKGFTLLWSTGSGFEETKSKTLRTVVHHFLQLSPH